MPTGYTANLEELNYDVKRWLKERVVRAMGVCCRLRDDGTMNQERIASALKKGGGSDNGYQKKELKKAVAKLEKMLAMSTQDWEAEYLETLEKAKSDYARDYKEWAKKRDQHKAALAEVIRMYKIAQAKSPADDPTVAAGTLKFAKEQLEQVILHEYTEEPYKDDVMTMKMGPWKKAQMDGAQWNVTYHQKDMDKEEKREDQSKSYLEFVEFIDKA